MKFNREARQLGYFLTEVWDFMAQYGPNFPNDEVRVHCITVALDGEAADWVPALHDANAKELHDFDDFMTALRQ